MFIAIVFIALGAFILLSTFGILTADFWGLFWGVVFLALGVKMLLKRGHCPMCGWHGWKTKMHGKMHGCCQHEEHEEHENK